MISDVQAAEAPRIVIPTRPLEVPPELLALQPDAAVCYSQAKNPGAYLQSAFGTAAEVIQLVRDTITRQAGGRLYIFEAAQVLADENGMDARTLLREMVRAFEAGRLRVRGMATGLPVSCSGPIGDYVTPADVNAWLDAEGAPFRLSVASVSASPEAVAAGHRRTPTVQEVIAPYVAKLMQEHPEYTADALYRRMRRDAGDDGSPFARLTPGGELFCVDAGTTCGISSVRAAVGAYRKARSSTVEAS